MKILAMKSSGDRTSVSVILNDEINSCSMTHQRKERPNWEMFLSCLLYTSDAADE